MSGKTFEAQSLLKQREKLIYVSLFPVEEFICHFFNRKLTYHFNRISKVKKCDQFRNFDKMLFDI